MKLSQNWRTVKRLVKESLYRKNITYENRAEHRRLGLQRSSIRQLTAIDEFNQLFEPLHQPTRQ